MPHAGGGTGHGPRFGVLLLAMAAFVLAGFPLVYISWSTLNHLLAGDLGAVRPLTSLGAVAGLGVLAWVLARAVERWTAT